jgi:hypothetical protein
MGERRIRLKHTQIFWHNILEKTEGEGEGDAESGRRK